MSFDIMYAILLVFRRFFLGLKIANIGLFGLKIGLPINIDLNDGRNKKQVHISKIVARKPNNGPKIGQLPLLRTDFAWA